MKEKINFADSGIQQVTEIDHSSKRLNYWLLKNMEVMKQIAINEPVCWREVDTPGVIKSKIA